jgi:transposase InsO family protein
VSADAIDSLDACLCLRPERPNHVWSYDIVQDSTEDGRRFRMLTAIDEFTRCALAIAVGANSIRTTCLTA